VSPFAVLRVVGGPQTLARRPPLRRTDPSAAVLSHAICVVGLPLVSSVASRTCRGWPLSAPFFSTYLSDFQQGPRRLKRAARCSFQRAFRVSCGARGARVAGRGCEDGCARSGHGRAPATFLTPTAREGDRAGVRDGHRRSLGRSAENISTNMSLCGSPRACPRGRRGNRPDGSGAGRQGAGRRVRSVPRRRCRHGCRPRSRHRVWHPVLPVTSPASRLLTGTSAPQRPAVRESIEIVRDLMR